MMTIATLILSAALGAGSAADTFAIHADRVLNVGDKGDRELIDGVVLVEDGQIRAVGHPGDVELPDGTRTVRHEGTVSAGMIACHGYPGAASDSADTTRSMLPDALMVHAFQPSHDDFDELVGAGITTVVLTPQTGTLVGGQTAVVKTAGGTIVKRRGHLAVSLSSEALTNKRAPTSAPGAVRTLERALASREGVWAEVADLQLPLLIAATDRHEVVRAIDLCRQFKIGGALYRATYAGEVRDHLRTTRLGVIAAPLAPGRGGRELASLVSIAELGIPLAFGLEDPWHSTDELRLSAAMCVRAGVEPQTAWRALTVDAARIAGVFNRVGSIGPGKDADLVLWSGDPLDLGSSVEAVYVDGEPVAGGNQ